MWQVTTFVVPGRPAPFVRATGAEYRIRNKPGIRRYLDYKQSVQEYADLHLNLSKITRTAEIVDVHVDAYLKRPHKKRWDSMNVYKAIEDAMNNLVYVDDKQVRNASIHMHVAREMLRTPLFSATEWVEVTVSRVLEAPWYTTD